MSETPRADVVIVTWNSARTVGACLSSLLEDPSNQPYVQRVVVVDNASHDGTREVLRRFSGRYPLAVVRNQRNVGFAAAVNQALGQLSGQHPVLLLNPDVVVAPHALRTLGEALVRQPDVGLVGPMILRPDGEVDQTCARADWTLWNLLCEVFALRRLPALKRVFGRYRLEHWDHRTAAEVPCVSGAACLVRTGLLTQERGLDTTIPMYYEDLELCWRTRDLGHRVWYEPKAAVMHVRASSSRLSPHREELAVMEEGDARWLALVRTGGRWRGAAATWVITLASAIRILMYRSLSLAARDQRRSHYLDGVAKYRALLRWSTQPKPAMTRMP
ncbi:MAG TPA: glycosyltransferase family 2 protein [Nitriliruptorales bacterium]|nr:glycosyltransferase family 2 protein [Nitriliruptorales bacterium]